MNSILDNLYREELLWTSQNMTNKKVMKSPTLKARQVNPLCGDEVTLMIKTKGEIIKDVTFDGVGCLISQVSASLLAKSLEGEKVREAQRFTEGKLLSILKIDPTPVRMKCALLPLWTLKDALKNYG